MRLSSTASFVAKMRRIGSVAVTVIESLGKWMNMVAMTVLFLMMFVMAIDTILRYFSPYSIPGAINLEEFFMVLVVFLALAYTQSVGGHVRVELLIPHLRGRIRTGINALALFLALGITCLITWQGWIMAWDAWVIKQYTHGTPHLPIYPFKFVVAFGGVLLCLQLLVHICRELWQPLGNSLK
jgi:TRAP-type mannitol/chloroaromatic compound transport system permease small subunit